MAKESSYKETSKKLAAKTKPKERSQVFKSDELAAADAETQRLCEKWAKLVSSGDAIEREEIQRGHGVPDMGWQEFLMKHFEMDDRREFGEDFFLWPDSDRMACLKDVDFQIGRDNVEAVLGLQGEKYERFRDQRGYESGMPSHAPDWDLSADGVCTYFDNEDRPILDDRATPSHHDAYHGSTGGKGFSSK